MVFDSLSNFANYNSVNPHFADVNNFLQGKNINDLRLGTFKINSKTSASVSEYMTKDISDCFIEYHKKFIDVQIVLSGKEKFGFCKIEDCRQIQFDEEKDFGKLEGNVNLLNLDEGKFIIVFPDDGHMPKVKSGSEPELIKKMVIKVPVE